MQLLLKNGPRTLLDVFHHGMHVLCMDDGSHFEQYARLRCRTRARNATRNIVKTFGVLEEGSARPVGSCLFPFWHRECRPLQSRLRDREQARQSVRRSPARAPCVYQNLCVGGNLRELVENLLEGILVE